MEVAVAWSPENGKTMWRRGLANQERMPRSDALEVTRALEEAGHEAWLVEADVRLLEQLGDLGRDGIVFHTAYGVQGVARYTHVPAMLEMAGIRYTGSDPLAHALALEKPMAKTIMASHGVPTPSWRTVAPGDAVPPLDLGWPVVVKPVREGGSLGLALAHDRRGLLDAVADVHDRFGQAALIERFVPGHDVMVPLLGNGAGLRVLPALRLMVEDGNGAQGSLLSQDVKEGRGAAVRAECPAALPEHVLRHAEAYSRLAFSVLGLSDWGRVDLRVTPDGQVHVLEVNSIPGLGARSSIKRSAEAEGLGFPGMLDEVVTHAARRWERREAQRPPDLAQARLDAHAQAVAAKDARRHRPRGP